MKAFIEANMNKDVNELFDMFIIEYGRELRANKQAVIDELIQNVPYSYKKTQLIKLLSAYKPSTSVDTSTVWKRKYKRWISHAGDSIYVRADILGW